MNECKEYGFSDGTEFDICPVCGHVKGSFALYDLEIMGVLDDE